jgi:hypothetical protein
MNTFTPVEAAAAYEALQQSGLHKLAAKWADNYQTSVETGLAEAFARLISDHAEGNQ